MTTRRLAEWAPDGHCSRRCPVCRTACGFRKGARPLPVDEYSLQQEFIRTAFSDAANASLAADILVVVKANPDASSASFSAISRPMPHERPVIRAYLSLDDMAAPQSQFRFRPGASRDQVDAKTRYSRMERFCLVTAETEFYARLFREFATIILPLRPSHVGTKPRLRPGAELLRLNRKR